MSYQETVRRDLVPEETASFLIAMVEGYEVLAKECSRCEGAECEEPEISLDGSGLFARQISAQTVSMKESGGT